VTASPLRNPRLHSADRLLGTRANHPPPGTPVPCGPVYRPVPATLESHVEKQHFCCRKCFRSTQQAGPIYVDHVALFATSPHKCLSLPAEICPAYARKQRRRAPRQLRTRLRGGAIHYRQRTCSLTCVLDKNSSLTLPKGDFASSLGFLDCFVFVLVFWVE
jgi:hypothetical protein